MHKNNPYKPEEIPSPSRHPDIQPVREPDTPFKPEREPEIQPTPEPFIPEPFIPELPEEEPNKDKS